MSPFLDDQLTSKEDAPCGTITVLSDRYLYRPASDGSEQKGP